MPRQTRLTNAQITEAWQRVAEDYAPFNIDVTTDLARYTTAPVTRRNALHHHTD
jgi:hypothetical protein